MCLCGAGDGVRAWSVDGGGGALALALGKRGNPPSLTVLDSNWETHSQVVCVHCIVCSWLNFKLWTLYFVDCV